MRRLPRSGLAGLLVAALAVAIAGSALAYFSSNGLGTASAAVSKLSAPTITAANPAAGGTVTLTWGAVAAPGTGTVTYYVTRDGEEAAGTCPAAAAPKAVTTCTDSGLAIATHVYTVTAVFHSWSATSGTRSAAVTIGAATHFTIAAASATPVVSVADNLTITAKDENESTVTTYTGSHSLTFSGTSSSPGGAAATVANASGTAVNFGTATALTFTAGVASVISSKNGLLKIYRAGSASIAATDGSLATATPLALTVTPGAATKYTLAATTTTPVAATTDNLTITAQDTYGNTATAYTGSHNLVFSGASASPGGNLPTVSDGDGEDIPFGTATEVVFNAGVASAAAADEGGEMKLYKSGATSVKATEGTITNATALALTVAAAATTKLVLTATTTTPVAAASDNLTTTAQDPYGNTATSYAGSKNIVFSGAEMSPGGTAPSIVNSAGTVVNFGAATALTFTAGVAAVTSSKNGLMRLNKAGAAAVSATDGSISTATPLAFTVLVGAASKLALTAVTASAGSIASTCFFTCPVTLGNSGTVAANVSVTDSVGNTVSELGSGHAAKVTTTGGTIAGTPLTIPETGPAVSGTRFTYTAPASGAFTNTITVATSTGTVYTSATVTASK